MKRLRDFFNRLLSFFKRDTKMPENPYPPIPMRESKPYGKFPRETDFSKAIQNLTQNEREDIRNNHLKTIDGNAGYVLDTEGYKKAVLEKYIQKMQLPKGAKSDKILQKAQGNQSKLSKPTTMKM